MSALEKSCISRTFCLWILHILNMCISHRTSSDCLKAEWCRRIFTHLSDYSVCENAVISLPEQSLAAAEQVPHSVSEIQSCKVLWKWDFALSIKRPNYPGGENSLKGSCLDIYYPPMWPCVILLKTLRSFTFVCAFKGETNPKKMETLSGASFIHSEAHRLYAHNELSTSA